MKQKIGNLLLVGMLLALFTVSTGAAEVVASGTCYGNAAASWTLDEDGILTISGKGTITNPADKTKVPWNNYISSIKKIVVSSGFTQIGQGAFHGCAGVTEVVLPETVTVIGDWAFGECDALTTVTLPGGLTKIGASAFYGCDALPSITIPEHVTEIGTWAFGYCANLTEVNLPSGSISLGNTAFYKCDSLEMVMLPANVKMLGEYCFAACTNLRVVVFQGYKTAVYANVFDQNHAALTLWGHDGIGVQRLAADRGIKYSVLGAGDDYFTGTCSDGLYWAISESGALRIYGFGSMQDYTETNREPWGYFKKFINTIRIEDGVLSLDDDVFLGYPKVTEVSLGAGLIDAGDHNFSECPVLTKFTVSETNTVYSVFDEMLCSKDGSTLHKYPAGKAPAEFTVPTAITALGTSALRGCSTLTELTLHENLTAIGDCAFRNCTGLTSMVIPETVTAYGGNVFTGCSALKWLDIRGDMEELCAYEFQNCTSLTWVRFPATVQKAAIWTFDGAPALKTLIFTGSAPLLSDEDYGGYFNYYGLGATIRRSVYRPVSESTWENLSNSSAVGFVPYIPGKIMLDREGAMATCAPDALSVQDGVMKIAVYDETGRMVSFMHCLYTQTDDAPIFHMMLSETVAENHTVKLFWMEEGTWVPLSSGTVE